VHAVAGGDDDRQRQGGCDAGVFDFQKKLEKTHNHAKKGHFGWVLAYP
jgi:hypothetical protein